MFIPALIALAALLVASDRPLAARRLVAAPADRALGRRAAACCCWVSRLRQSSCGWRSSSEVAGRRCSSRRSVSRRRSRSLSTAVRGLAMGRRSRAGCQPVACRPWRVGVAGRDRARVEPERVRGVGAARGPSSTTARRSRSAGRSPPGTLVQGKLANGLALENRIRPIFVGHGFGNYDDRLKRDDARYILTYVLPRVGYESQDGSGLIQEILDAVPQSPHRREFDVDETPDPDRAALIDKFPQCARLETTSSRRTPTGGFAPNTTTRSSSTTGAPRSSRFSSAPASTIGGRVLDAGCGGGGMPLSLAEHADRGRRHRPDRSVRRRRRRARPRARPRPSALRPRRRHGAAVRRRRVRSGAVARGDRARARRAAVPARVPARAEAGGPLLPVDRAVSLVCRRASAAAARAGAAAPAARPRRLRSARSGCWRATRRGR